MYTFNDYALILSAMRYFDLKLEDFDFFSKVMDFCQLGSTLVLLYFVFSVIFLVLHSFVFSHLSF